MKNTTNTFWESLNEQTNNEFRCDCYEYGRVVCPGKIYKKLKIDAIGKSCSLFSPKKGYIDKIMNEIRNNFPELLI